MLKIIGYYNSKLILIIHTKFKENIQHQILAPPYKVKTNSTNKRQASIIVTILSSQ